MSDEPFKREIRDGVEVLVYPNGIIKEAATGHFLRPPDSALINTSERGRELAQRKKEIGQIAQLRGLARGAGLDLDNATLEEIAKGAGDAIENMTAHFYQVFMKSSNVRGLAEAYKGMTAPMLGDPEAPKTTVNFHAIELGKTTAALLAVLRQALDVEGNVIDVDPKG
jgi:hypothetical protein